MKTGKRHEPPTSSQDRSTMNILFVCTRNRLRSPTAEAVFERHPDCRVIAAGTDMNSPTPVTGDLIEWADAICVMEKVHQRRLMNRFGRLLQGRRIIVLGIPDNYRYMQPELQDILKRRVCRALDLT